MTAEQYFSAIKPIIKAAEEAGFTPFDLLSWPFLLESKTEINNESCFLDLNLRIGLRDAIDTALKRKAAMLDEMHKSDFHQGMLKTFNL